MIPLIYEGNGKFSASSIYHRMRCEKLFGAGQEITFEELGDRNMNRHRMYFARLKELWLTLPESMAEDFPSPEALRKYALVRTGYCTQKKIICQSNQIAIETAAFIESLGTYVICEVVMRVLTIWVPQSQAVRNMGKSEFDKSVTDVLDYAEKLVSAGPGNVIPFGGRKE